MLIFTLIIAIVSSIIFHISTKRFWLACVGSVLITGFMWWVFDGIFYGNPLDRDVMLSVVPISIGALIVSVVVGGIRRIFTSKQKNITELNS